MTDVSKRPPAHHSDTSPPADIERTVPFAPTESATPRATSAPTATTATTATPAPASEDASGPATSSTPAATSVRRALLVACGAAFVAFLDLSVVNIAFPAISRDYPTTAATTLTWIVSGYAVAFAALLTPAGRFADALGRRRVFLWAIAGFALTSLLCALAPTAGWLIAGRFLQGATAAFMIPAGLGLVLAVTAPARIGVAIAAWTAAGGFAALVGPAIGGGLVEWFGWRSVFVINVPVAAALILVGGTITGVVDRHGGGMPDVLGTLATALGIGGVVAAVTEGQQWGWTSWRTLAVGIAGLVLIAIALLRSRTHARPAIAVGLWSNHRYALVNATSFVFGAAMFAWLLAGPLWLDSIWQYSVLESAGAMTFGAVASMITAVLAGRAPESWQRWLAVLGAVMFAASTLYMTTDLWDTTPELWRGWLPAGILGGGGIGMILTVLGATSARALPPQQFAAGIGMNLTARQAGGALGVAALAAVFSAQSDTPLTAFHTLFAVCAVIAVAAALVAAIPTRSEETLR